MDEHILVPFDGSPLARRALERALDAHPEAAITVIHAIDPVTAVYEAESGGLPAAEAWPARAQELAEDCCREAEAIAAERNRSIATATAVGGPARVVLEYIEDHDVDCVVMGSHGRTGVSALVLGSVAEKVMRQSPVPVTVVR